MNRTTVEALNWNLNRMAILRQLAASPGESRGALTRALGLPRSTISFLVRNLVDEGWLRESCDARTDRPGGKKVPLFVQPDRLLLVHVEPGPFSVQVEATSLAAQSLARDEASWAPDDGADRYLDLAAQLLLRIHRQLYSPLRRVLMISVGPGPVAGSAPLPQAWQGASLAHLLEDRLRHTPLRQVPVELRNDCTVMAKPSSEALRAGESLIGRTCVEIGAGPLLPQMQAA